VTFTAHSPGHSWQNVSACASSIGDKGTVYAAKVLADAAVTLFRSPDTLGQAKRELNMRLEEDPYVCPIPAGAVPYVVA
jgi:aminobenzoyl-glutamate utilization protein B